MQTVHQAVLLNEVVGYMKENLESKKQALVFDGTLGSAGHSSAMLEQLPNIFLIGVDRDLFAVARSQQRLAAFAKRCYLSQANFAEIKQIINSLPQEVKEQITNSSYPLLDRIVLDLGISSDQLDDPKRGFSFMQTGPLDMRMNQEEENSAETILNKATEHQLRKIFLMGGVKKPFANILSLAVIKNRPLKTTKQFADLCAAVIHPPRKKTKQVGFKKHPATLPFQALRIAVNEEIISIEKFMQQAIDLLAPGGRLAVISFHSLEDKVVTNAMRRWTQTPVDDQVFSLKTQAPTLGKLLTKKAVFPTEAEVIRNPRSRSARLRVFEKIIN